MKENSKVPQNFISNLTAAMPSIKDAQALGVMGSVPRQPFVPAELRERAYDMIPLSYYGEVWPHPAIIAYMLQALKPKSGEPVLVIGSLGGYLAALLVALGARPTVVETSEQLASTTRTNLQAFEIPEVTVTVLGAQFQLCVGRFASIVSTYALVGIPYDLIDLMGVNGRLVTASAPHGLPSSQAMQNLILIEKNTDGEVREGVRIYPRIRMADLLNVEFVPLVRGSVERQPFSQTSVRDATENKRPGSDGTKRESKPSYKRSGYTTEEALRLASAGPRTGVFTDGSANPNPGPGGWGYVYVEDDQIISQECGYDPDTTNNKMELTALIHAYQSLPLDAKVEIYSDSNLCVKTINEWARSWERNGWKRKTGPIANLDLVQELYAEAKRRPGVKLKWIEAHNGWKWNEYADALSTSWQR